MGALEDIIFQSLGGAAKPDFTAGDPYAEPNQFVTQTLQTPILQAALKPDRGGYGTGELIGGALISGLLGGGLSGLSKDYQTEQKNIYNSALLNSVLGGPKVDTSGLEPSLFDTLNANVTLFDVGQTLQNRAAETAAKNDLRKTITEGVLKSEDPDIAFANLEKLSSYLANKEARPMISEVDAAGAIPGAPLSETVTKPNLLNKKTKAEIDLTDSLRKEFNALQDVKDYAQSLKAANSLSQALKDQSAVSDQELVRRAIQMIEPGMAVREGEASAVQNSAAIPEAWRGALNKALGGGTALGEDVRAGIQRLAERAFTAHATNYEAARKTYGQIAESRGLKPDQISFLGQAPQATSIFKSSGVSTGGASISQVQQIIAAAKAQYGDTAEGKAAAQAAIQKLSVPSSGSGVPRG